MSTIYVEIKAELSNIDVAFHTQAYKCDENVRV